jgi:hypothetical protein
LSPERERWAAGLAGAAGAGLVVAAMAGAAALVSALGLVVHAPTFFVAWLGVAGAVGLVSARRVRARVGRYRLGADIEADAFAMAELDLVRRAGGDYDIGIVPGMSGSVEAGRSCMPLEALSGRGAVRVPLPRDGKVRVDFGSSTFVIARRTEVPHEGAPFRDGVGWLGAGTLRRLVRAAALGTPAAIFATLFGSVPAALAMTDADGRWAIPGNATPVETERLIRAKAQVQAPALHQCFDPMPRSCQRAGYVGVGLSLSKEGEVLSHWISRSTYDQNCPVSECMADVVSRWVFEPMRERMTLVIPIQVKRTKRSAGDQPAYLVAPSLGDAGTGCLDSDAGRVSF